MRLFRLFIPLVLLLCLAFQSGAQVVAGFTASPTTGCAPLLVNFTNTTTPVSGTTYSWNFGVSGTSVLTNPSTSFTTPGTHVVTLTATNGSSVGTYTLAITVYPPPTVNFVADDTAVCPCTPITFSNTSVAGVPGGMTCSWNWGDGSGTTVGSPATHSYCTPGYYTVTLFVTNAQGCQASLTKTAYIHVYNPPVALFSSPGGCNPPVTVPFTFTGSGTPPLSHTWSWGDSSPDGTGSSPSHNYTATGTYPVRLITVDANGCADTFTQNVVISSLTAAFTGSDTICQNGTAVFTVTTPPPFTATWNYGDGPGSFPGTPGGSHTYPTPGTYNVTLTLTNGPCVSTISHPVVVLPNPVVTLTVNPTNPCPAPASITYSGPPGYSYSWTFDPATTSGSTGSGSPATFTYPTNGVKNYSVTITDVSTGCVSYAAGSITIYDIIFNVLASPVSGCVPLTVNFNTTLYTSIPGPGLGPYPYGPLSGWSWNFGDGGTATGTGTPSHTYTAIGIYTATVSATTANGCPVTGTIEIRVGKPPQVTFTAAPRHVCYGEYEPVIFTPTIIVGPVDSWFWDYDDGYSETINDTANFPPNTVSHVYILPGIFSPSVTPYYLGCPGPTYSITDYITIDSPKSIIGHSILCNPRKRVNFTNLSLGDDSHLWIFGDGTTSTLDNPVKDYAFFGAYGVQLATYNNASGCRDTAYLNIFLDSVVPSFVADQTAVCRGSVVTFTSTTSGGTPLDYRWYDNGTLFAGPPTSGPVEARTMSVTGYHTIMLITRNANNCYDTARMVNYVLVSSPTVNFTIAPASGCAPVTIGFTSTSTPTTGTSLSTYTWDFGDGTFGTGTPISHTYTAAGSYSVELKLTDNLGCMDSMTHPTTVNVWDPVASFTATNTHPCLNSPVTFNSTSSGTIATYSWDFGDGSALGTGASPVHSYSATGSYNITLTITDTHGCTDVATSPAYIVVTQPVASFNMSDSVSVCPPLFVNFTNTSTGAVAYSWDFGDGGTSLIASPSNMYISSGLYPVRLIATNMYGCKDTAYRNVNIFGYAGALSYTPLQGCAPLTVFFTATLTNVPFITWDFSDGFTSTMSFTDTISHTYVTPGAYIPKLLLSDNTGCQTSSVGLDTIKVDGIIPKFNTEPSPVCIGETFTFIDSSEGYWNPVNSWVWTFDGNTSTLESPTYTINTPGTYPVTLVVTNAWGCTATITRELVVEPPPVVWASRDTVVCVGDPATLYGYGAATYEWSEPSPTTLSCTACNPTNATPVVETIYTVTGTDTRGCKDTATVTVGLRTHTISGAWGDTAVCFGVPVPLFDTGGHTYLWLPATGLNDNTIANPIAMPPHTVIYMAIARLGSCIPDTNYVTVTIYPLPTIDAGPNQRVVAGSAAQINAKGTDVATLLWTPSESLSCDDCFAPVATMTMNTTYHANVTSEHGCKASDSVTILIYCDNSQVFVPNSFTPNGDGQNDVFYPRGIGIKAVKTFRIYNRWGEMLFERENILLNDAVNAWDGSYKGGAPKPDVYVYIIEAICYTGDDVFIKGDVTIIR